MTEPAGAFAGRAALLGLIEQWRSQAVVVDGSMTLINGAFYKCADELDALVRDTPATEPPVKETLGDLIIAFEARLSEYETDPPALTSAKALWSLLGAQPAPVEEDEPDITIGGAPWTDEQLADLRALALQGDLKSARALLEANGYTVGRVAQAPAPVLNLHESRSPDGDGHDRRSVSDPEKASAPCTGQKETTLMRESSIAEAGSEPADSHHLEAQEPAPVLLQADTHEYVSTACQHGLHDRCRQRCKFCHGACRCACHPEVRAQEPAPVPISALPYYATNGSIVTWRQCRYCGAYADAPAVTVRHRVPCPVADLEALRRVQEPAPVLPIEQLCHVLADAELPVCPNHVDAEFVCPECFKAELNCDAQTPTPAPTRAEAFTDWAERLASERENYGFDNYVALLTAALVEAYEQGSGAAPLPQYHLLETDAQEPAPAPSLWQPIASAPKDADLVLLYLDGSGVLPGYWDDDKWLATETRGLTGGGWHAEPTHWMPLPAAPAPSLWQPIETAPNDVSMLLWYPLAGTSFRGRGSAVEELAGPGGEAPTHWMPLPASPAPSQEP